MIELSKYFSDDGKREAVIFKENDQFIVKYFELGKLVGEYKDKIEYSAGLDPQFKLEDMAEDFVLGISH
jgi:hypothetical protein